MKAASTLFCLAVPTIRNLDFSRDLSKPFPLFPQSDQFYAAMTREFDTMWSGERSVEEAVKALDQAARSSHP